MKIIIRSDRKIGNQLIAEYKFNGARIIDRIVDFLSNIDETDLYVVSDRDLKLKNVKNIPLSEADLLKDKIVIDLKFVYDGRKLKKLIKRKKSLDKSVIIENETLDNLNNFGCLYERKEWNPISKFYVEPLGEKIGYWLRKTRVSPNAVSFSNIILSSLISLLLFFGGTFGVIIFGIWVRIFHILDIVDGQIARLKCQGTKFGKWVDGGTDRFVIGLWHMTIAVSLYIKSQKIIFLFAGLLVLFGNYMYNYLLLTSVAYFRGNRFDYKSSSGIKTNPIIKFILLFVNHDIQLHILTLCAFIAKLDWFILFYAFYFNFMWFMYFLFYLIEYFRKGDVKEV